MGAVDVYRTSIDSEWIDYNGHLRDAYYSLIISFSVDAFMERVGLDGAYRERTGCSLYTLELHLRFLREVKRSDVVDVAVRGLEVGPKVIRAAFEMRCGRYLDPVASAEVVLMHVLQGEKPKGQVFPAEVRALLDRLADEMNAASPSDTAAPGSEASPSDAAVSSSAVMPTAGAATNDTAVSIDAAASAGATIASVAVPLEPTASDSYATPPRRAVPTGGAPS